MKLHLIVVALAVAVSACRSSTQSSPPRPPVDYMTETNTMACMIEQDPTKRTICIARTRYSVSHCAPIVDEAQRTFCIEAVKVEIQRYNQRNK